MKFNPPFKSLNEKTFFIMEEKTMKKLSRIAALLAAGALLFGAFGCSDDDNEEKDPPKPQTETVSYTLKDGTQGFDSGSLKVSGMNTTEDTSDDTFEMTLTPEEGTAEKVKGTWKLNDGSTTEFTCKSDESVEINGVPVTPDTVVTGTMNGDTISLSIPTGTTSVTLTFVKSTGGGNGDGDGDKATAKTYDFATWSAADLAAFGGEFYTDSKNNAKNQLKSPEGTTELSTGATIYNKAANAIMIRTVSTTDNTPTALNYNGAGNDDLSSGVDVSKLDRYVSIPVDGAGKITASVKFVNSSSANGNLQAVFVDADGKLLGTVVEKDAKTGGEATIEGTTAGATTVILAFSRKGAGGGGLDVYSISVE